MSHTLKDASPELPTMTNITELNWEDYLTWTGEQVACYYSELVGSYTLASLVALTEFVLEQSQKEGLLNIVCLYVSISSPINHSIAQIHAVMVKSSLARAGSSFFIPPFYCTHVQVTRKREKGLASEARLCTS